MPTFDLNTLMSKATTRMGWRTDIAASEVSFWVNVAYQEVAEEANPSALERIAFTSVSSGESRITPPANTKQIISLSYMTTEGSSAKTLQRAAPEEIDASGFFPSAKPTHYMQFRDWIELWPSPNSAWSIVMRYHSYATDMVAGTQVPSVETPWRPAILFRAEALLHESIGNDEEAAIANLRYENYIGALHTSEARRQASSANFRIKMPSRRRRLSG